MYNLITKNDVVLYITEDSISLPSMASKITFIQQPFNREVTVGGQDINNLNAEIKITTDSLPEDFIGCKYVYTTEFELNPNYREPVEED